MVKETNKHTHRAEYAAYASDQLSVKIAFLSLCEEMSHITGQPYQSVINRKLHNSVVL